MKKTMLAFIVPLAWSIIVCGCNTSSVTSRKEIKRLASPDGRIEAVLVETNDGATTSFGYNLYIVPKGQSFKVGHELLIADHVKYLEVAWKKPKLLGVSFKEARIFNFSNFWQSKEVDDFGYIVGLQLNSNTDTFSLSEQVRRLR